MLSPENKSFSSKYIFLVVENNMKVLCQFLSSRCVPNVVIDSSTWYYTILIEKIFNSYFELFNLSLCARK